MNHNALTEVRHQISDIDDQMLALMAQRQTLTDQVAETKITHHLNVRDQIREEELLVTLIKRGQQHGLDPLYVTKLFHVIIEESVLHQQALLAERANPELTAPLNRVAFLGTKGSYSYLATQKFFNRRNGELLEMGCKSFDDIVDTVEQGKADYAVLPIENTSSGSINEVYDLLQHTSLSIVGELTHPVEHTLLVAKPMEVKDIRVVYGHPQALSQCSKELAALVDVELRPADSTSAAMALVQELDEDHIAAVGSEAGGNIYGLTPIKSNIANQKENHSRFIVISRKPVKVPLQIPAKTTLVMSTVQQAGALVDALTVLKNNDIKMTKLESRPIPGNPWEEMFYLDVEGNLDDGPMQQVMEDLQGITRYLKVLGCYPIEQVSPTKVRAAEALRSAAQK